MQVLFARIGSKTDFKSDKPFYINNCGCYKDIDRDIVINRPHGRDDYHMLLVSSGNIFVGKQHLVPGKLYFYYPGSPQSYRYESCEQNEYYWVHFSGEGVSSLLDRYELREGVIDIGSSRGEAERIIKMMIRAISEKYVNADEFCEGMLRALLALVSAPPVISSPYYKAIRLFGDPTCNKSIEEIASIYNMSPNHFIRSFKKYVGMSPNAYRISKRMETAEELLSSSEMNIEQIAAAVGYSDPLYFSRAFKTHVGMSPSKYRKSKKN